MPRKLIISFLIIMVSCADVPNFLQLGIESFNSQNYSLAKNQLMMIEPSGTDFKLASQYLKEIDSIETSRAIKVQQRDSIRNIEIEGQIKEHLGNYKVDVNGATISKSVEVYSLKEEGKSVWLWVDYVGGNPVIDDRKQGSWWLDSKGSIIIRIQGNSGPLEEVFSNIDGHFVESNRKKRSLVKTQESFTSEFK